MKVEHKVVQVVVEEFQVAHMLEDKVFNQLNQETLALTDSEMEVEVVIHSLLVVAVVLVLVV